MTSPRPILRRDDLRGRRALVLGLARSGTALARFLADAGADVTVYDRRSEGELEAPVRELDGRKVRLALGVTPDQAASLLEAADLVLTSPSISPRFPTTEPWLREALRAAERRGAELVSEVDLFLRLTTARILAVTGTKGKTTTTALVGAILAEAGVPHQVGGNIGRPLVELADRLSRGDWAVVELSELQLPTISRGADVAVYTNILADHLDRHGTVEAYRAVKARLAELAPRGGRVVLNRHDPGSVELGARLARGVAAWYGLEPTPDAVAWAHDGWLHLGSGPVLPEEEVLLPGRHMRLNVLAALAGATLAGADVGAAARAIRAFRGVPHRLESIAERGGVRYVNDSQATIPLATLAALEAFAPAPVVLVAGGQGKGLDYAELADAIVERCRATVLIGETADELERLLAGRVPVKRATSMPEAVEAAARLARPGDVVLLSPAAASFDMFSDYAARGDAFRGAVSGLDA